MKSSVLFVKLTMGEREGSFWETSMLIDVDALADDALKTALLESYTGSREIEFTGDITALDQAEIDPPVYVSGRAMLHLNLRTDD